MTVPPSWPPPGWPPAPPPPPDRPQRPPRPADVDTGFWLWLAALPVLTIGYLVNSIASPEIGRVGALYPVVALIAVLVGALVVTFLILMRSGYRWARTALTGGGVAAVVYAVSGVFDADQRPAVAVTSAITGIVGSVLIAGGTFLLHRSDAQEYFTR
ncbi:MAG TPA: hypothetical protein VFR27_15615 [Mycobacterium sp.]|nr:hypothetical protein [Mycobacterium sp.]